MIILALMASYLIYESERLVLLKRAVHHVPDYAVLGQEEASLTVVEFLDYSCPRCQNTHPSLKAVLEREKNYRYIPRPFSSDNQGGHNAALFVYAAGRQGQFQQAHERLITNYRAVDDVFISRLTSELGLDLTQIERDMKDPEILEIVENNLKYNGQLGAVSIPTFLINNRIVWFVSGEGANIEQITNVINEAKQSQ